MFSDKDAKDYRAWKGWRADRFGAYSPVEEKYFEAELLRAGVNELNIRVLEIGFGNGNFIGFACDRGARIVGVEADAELVSAAIRYGIEAHVINSDWQGKVGSTNFDLIVAFDVFEHMELEVLVETLRYFGTRLSKAGVIMARFPSGDSPFSGAMYYGDMTHVTYLGTSKVEQLARSTGLELVFMREACLPIKGNGFRRAARRLPIVLARALVGHILRVTYYNNQPRVLDPNAVAVFRKSRSLSY